MELSEELAQNATAFSAQLMQVAVLVDAELSQSIRKGVLDVYKNITRRSPVDTGAYRASNDIADHDPAPGESVVKGVKGQTIPAPNKSGWKWKVGDGDIWLFNNVPYAKRIEDGWSKPGGKGRSVIKAPQGVYRLALIEVGTKIQQEVAKMKTLMSTGEGPE